MNKRSKRTTPWLKIIIAISTLLVMSVSCNPFVRDARPSTVELYDEARSCRADNSLEEDRQRCYEEISNNQYEANELSTLVKCDSVKDDLECFTGFEDRVATAEDAGFDEEATRIAEEIGDADEESANGLLNTLTLSNTTAEPQDCVRWTTQTVNPSARVRCTFRLSAEASWETSLSPAYIHCLAWGSGVQFTSAHALAESKGVMEVEVSADEIIPLGYPDQDHDWVPDEAIGPEEGFYMPMTCLLTDVPDYEDSWSFSITVRCENPEVADSNAPGFCQAPFARSVDAFAAPFAIEE